MKKILTIILLFYSCALQAQKNSADFASIDWNVQWLEAESPDSLGLQLAVMYHTDMEKARAVFSWIVQHISYNTGFFNRGRNYVIAAGNDTWDTAMIWKSGEEMTACKVMRRKEAVCDGYAKLFKTLCHYAGLQAEVITGYARCRLEKNDKFRTNHSWNAVLIDQRWYLVDVTWASGYINEANEYVHHLDESYFMAAPRQFILDHFPEDIRWTLLDDPPALREFHFSPFRCKSFVKYGIQTITPSNGRIEARTGDTVQFELQVRDAGKNRQISSDPFFDSTMLENSQASVFLNPSGGTSHIRYQYVVTSEPPKWINIIYNDDMVLRYQLEIKKEKNAYR